MSISRPQHLPREPHATADPKGRTGNTQRGGGGKPRAPSCLGARARLGVWPARTRVSTVGATVRHQHLLTLVHAGAGPESLVRNSPAGRPWLWPEPTGPAGPPARGVCAAAHTAAPGSSSQQPHVPDSTGDQDGPQLLLSPPEITVTSVRLSGSAAARSHPTAPQPGHRLGRETLASARGRHPWPIGQHTVEQSGCNSRRGLRGAVTPDGDSVPGCLEEQSQNGKG